MQIILWVILLPIGATGAIVWIFRIPDHGAIPHWVHHGWNRFLGEYHRFQRGKVLDGVDQERYRTQILGVRTYSVDRYISFAPHSLCIVTNRSISIQDTRGSHVHVLGNTIRSVRARRDYDQRTGFSYWVVMERVGSPEHQPEGDLALKCVSQEQSQALFNVIKDIQFTGLSVNAAREDGT